MNPTVRIPVLLGLLVMAGCKSFSCDAPPSYGTKDSIAPLKVPVGLEAPDTRNALHIPDPSGPERPRDREAGCLEEPPPYFKNGRPGEGPPAEEKPAKEQKPAQDQKPDSN